MAKRGLFDRKPKVTANQLGYKVQSLVLYKNNPYHIVAIDRTGTLLTIKKCENAKTIRDDVALEKVKLVDKKDPLYSKWGILPSTSQWGRTREEELFVLKALVDSTSHVDSDARKDIVAENLKRNTWLGVWFTACYSANRNYRLKPKHVKQVRNMPRSKDPLGIFVLLAKLQYNRLKPKQAAIEWLSMLETMDRDVWRVANMVLLRQFGNITYNEIRYAMRSTGYVPCLPKKGFE